MRRLLGRVLALCAAGGDPDRAPEGLAELVDGREVSGLVPAARYHGLSGLAYRRLRAVPDADPETVEALGEEYHRNVGNHLRTLADLAAATEALDATGCPWLVVKGPALAEAVYGDPGLRTYSDLDLVVEPSGFAEALDVLERAGGRLLDRNWRLIGSQLRGQVHVALPFGTVADVHWHLVNHSREPYDIPMADLFARSVRLDGLGAAGLDPVDGLIHLCLHAGLAGGRRLIWLADVDRTVSQRQVPWDEVVERSRSWGVAPVVGVVLRRACRVVGTEVPDEVLRALGPPAASRALLAALDRAAPLECSTSARPMAEAVARTAGRRPWSTAVVLGRGLRMRVGGRIQRARYGHQVMAPSGDDRDRAAYLDAVGCA